MSILSCSISIDNAENSTEYQIFLNHSYKNSNENFTFFGGYFKITTKRYKKTGLFSINATLIGRKTTQLSAKINVYGKKRRISNQKIGK